MTLLEIREKFSENMSNIELSHRMTKHFYKEYTTRLAKDNKIFQEDEDDEPVFENYHNMVFTDPRNGEHIYYAHRTISFDDQIIQCVLKKNREYQFLLMEAYEIFEDTIEEIYAYLGKNDINFWELHGFGNITYDKIAEQDFSFYLQCAKKRKHRAIGIAKMLIDKFDCNQMFVPLDLKNCIILIGRIRHIIVHEGGIIKNKDEFILDCANSCQKYKNNTADEKFKEYLNYFIGESNSKTLISLTEERILPELPILIERCRFEALLNHLLVCVHILCDESKKHIDNLPQTINNNK